MNLQILEEYGGVCGTIGRFGASCAWAFGIPAMPSAQPGHCAYVWQRENHRWWLSNAATGDFAETFDHDGYVLPFLGHQQWCVLLMQVLQTNEWLDRFVKSNIQYELQKQQKRSIPVMDIIKICPLNITLYESCYIGNELDKMMIVEHLYGFPQVLADILLRNRSPKETPKDITLEFVELYSKTLSKFKGGSQIANKVTHEPGVHPQEISKNDIQHLQMALVLLLKEAAFQTTIKRRSEELVNPSFYMWTLSQMIRGHSWRDAEHVCPPFQSSYETMNETFTCKNTIQLMWDCLNLFEQHAPKKLWRNLYRDFVMGLKKNPKLQQEYEKVVPKLQQPTNKHEKWIANEILL